MVPKPLYVFVLLGLRFNNIKLMIINHVSQLHGDCMWFNSTYNETVKINRNNYILKYRVKDRVNKYVFTCFKLKCLRQKLANFFCKELYKYFRLGHTRPLSHILLSFLIFFQAAYEPFLALGLYKTGLYNTWYYTYASIYAFLSLSFHINWPTIDPIISEKESLTLLQSIYI